MQDLGRLEPREEPWLVALRELRTAIEKHIREEETEVWPRIRQFWGEDKLSQVGGQVQAAKLAAGAGAVVSTGVGAIGEVFKGPPEEMTEDHAH